MKVLLINISLRPESPQLIFPVGLGYIATAIERAGFKLKIIDTGIHRYKKGQVESIVRHMDFDAVAFGCIVTGFRKVAQLAAAIKWWHPDVPIICGNTVASSIHEILLRMTNVDIAVMGEGDETIVELLTAIRDGTPLEAVKGVCYMKGEELMRTPHREVIKNLDSIPMINWALFNIYKYVREGKTACAEPYPIPYDEIRAMPINTARGCPYNCSFCHHSFVGEKYRVRSPKSICEEIKTLQEKYNVNYVNFWDELTFKNVNNCEALVNKLLDENIEVFWAADIRADLFTKNDTDLVYKMKEAGCVGLGYSLESADPQILKAMNKKLSVSRFSEQTKVLQEAGIATWTSLVLGYPQETEETIKKTFDCCYENNMYPSIGYLLPQPGSLMYEYALKVGAIKDEEEYLMSMGDRQDLSVNLTTMSNETFERVVNEEARKLLKKLGLGDVGDPIKTGVYKANKVVKDA